MSEFKVGDKVRVIEGWYDADEVGEITAIGAGDDPLYAVTFSDGDYTAARAKLLAASKFTPQPDALADALAKIAELTAAHERAMTKIKQVCQVARDGWWLPNYDAGKDYTPVVFEGYREITLLIAEYLAHEYALAANEDAPAGE